MKVFLCVTSVNVALKIWLNIWGLKTLLFMKNIRVSLIDLKVMIYILFVKAGKDLKGVE
ncbi:hypothetical protein SEEM842_13696 [Salmonella enterica subsp. enterica serovar Senftenberg str. 423984-2]|nr:hypothetical protein SEEM038_21533 [Salmonella enterica subsp. enterica serovar Senftenberg str. NC_MB012510-0038]ESG33529.1 hypothetical protein SEEM842_13696 [Salmonella enterica subsp. enterica serovar Senftenberg str. 423984-2]ESG55640.1 hypothetical protein SEEM162_16277 [Salmonella enterica subsp. enterica serovar Senftenberg str. 316235162]